MGYLHIENLYKIQDILLFKQCYALEKIHGTSAHINFNAGNLSFFSGGASKVSFEKLFDHTDLLNRFKTLDPYNDNVVIFGEAYGGSMQKMSSTYGKELRFIVFDVQVGDSWLSVPQAEDVAKKLGLEFVHYTLIPAEIKDIDAARDSFSHQAKVLGCGDKYMEGVVLRPLIELTKNNGNRVIVKHKRDEFKETATPRPIDTEKQKVLDDANAIALEWVTPMRLTHVLDKLPKGTNIENTRDVISAMIEDVKRESVGEVVWSREVETAISRNTAKLFKESLQLALTNS